MQKSFAFLFFDIQDREQVFILINQMQSINNIVD